MTGKMAGCDLDLWLGQIKEQYTGTTGESQHMFNRGRGNEKQFCYLSPNFNHICYIPAVNYGKIKNEICLRLPFILPKL